MANAGTAPMGDGGIRGSEGVGAACIKTTFHTMAMARTSNQFMRARNKDALHVPGDAPHKAPAKQPTQGQTPPQSAATDYSLEGAGVGGSGAKSARTSLHARAGTPNFFAHAFNRETKRRAFPRKARFCTAVSKAPPTWFGPNTKLVMG